MFGSKNLYLSNFLLSESKYLILIYSFICFLIRLNFNKTKVLSIFYYLINLILSFFLQIILYQFKYFLIILPSTTILLIIFLLPTKLKLSITRFLYFDLHIISILLYTYLLILLIKLFHFSFLIS